MPITFTGLASGLDTQAIITEITRFGQARIDSLRAKEDAATGKQTVLNSIKTRLAALQTSASKLARGAGGVFDRRAVTSSDESLIKAAAGSAASAGTQSLRVLQVARNHQIASQGFADANSEITQGTIQLKIGSGATTTITIDNTNNTLAGLAQAINDADAGVTASVINDGSGSATQPYRLMLSSTKTGTDNAISFTNNLAADAGGAIRPNLSSTHIGSANASTTLSGTSVVTSNAGAGGYSGNSNDTFTFTVQTGGTVGADNGLQIAYSDISGTRTGTIAVDAGDAGVLKTVVDGVQVQFAAGTLVAGDQFTVDVFAPTIQSATNAQVQLGSGAGALVVSSSTNQLTGVIPGVTLDLQSADPTKEVRLTIANDVAAAKKEIEDFVKAYNDFIGYVDEQTKFDSATGTGGPLSGERAVRALRDEVQRMILSTSANLPSQSNRLSALGIASDSKGKLVINDARLSDILNGRVAGVTFADVKSLFALQGQSSSGAISFVTASRKTKDSVTPYGIDVTQAAERATLTAGNSLANSIVIDGTNNELTLSLDGSTNTTITLADGTYTTLGLAQELKAQINNVFSSSGQSLDVSLSGQSLKLTSVRYGSASEISLVSGSALSVLGFAGGESDNGQDVTGFFYVDGNLETASGLGQVLTGVSSNANTADLGVRVGLSSSQVQPGVDATMTVSHGLASRMNNLLTDLLDPVSGRFKIISDRFAKNVEQAESQINRETIALDDRKATLLRQFANLEQTINRFRTQGDFVTNSLAGLRGARSN